MTDPHNRDELVFELGRTIGQLDAALLVIKANLEWKRRQRQRTLGASIGRFWRSVASGGWE